MKKIVICIAFMLVAIEDICFGTEDLGLYSPDNFDYVQNVDYNELFPGTNSILNNYSFSINTTSINLGSEFAASYTVTNMGANDYSFNFIIAIYSQSGQLLKVDCKKNIAPSREIKTVAGCLSIPGNYPNCFAKVLIWDGEFNLTPFCTTTTIGANSLTKEISAAAVDCEPDEDYYFSIFGSNLPPNSNNTYKIKYNPAKIQAEDLCGLTYKTELSPENIDGLGINIIGFNENAGEIVFSVTNQELLSSSKIVECVRFRACTPNSKSIITVG